MLLRRPVGVVAAITPWNFPLVMAVWKVGCGARRRMQRRAQAGAGDAVDVDRASPSWPAKPGCPPTCSRVVTGDAEVGEALVDHDRHVDMVTVTGSTATGRRVMAARRGAADESPPRARRQGAVRRVRRRRCRRRWPRPRRWPRRTTPARTARRRPACTPRRRCVDELLDADRARRWTRISHRRARTTGPTSAR